MSCNKTILHITTHLGGGVGKVVTNYLKKSKTHSKFTHTIVSLDYINEEAKEILTGIKIDYNDKLHLDIPKLMQMIQTQDIILIHWWNHPLMYEFLVKYTLPKSRVLIWSHISGLHEPSNFTKPLFDYADKFIFTTPISLQTDIVKKLSPKNQQKLSTIWSTGDLKHVKKVRHKQHNGFNVGYIGTVDYSKLHRDFLDISAKIDIKDIQFIVCGGDDEKNIKQEAMDKNISEKFKFTGKVSNIKAYLSVFDVFGYPLSPYHYGTCDQALAEAMACGIVPVVFNNPMEKYMVKHNKTGLVVKNNLEYNNAIEELYSNKKLRERLSKKAKKEAFKRFSLKNMIKQWEKTFEQSLNIKKTIKKWKSQYQGPNSTYFQIFIESTGKKGIYFENMIFSEDIMIKNKAEKIIKEMMQKSHSWNSKTKGTLNHYLCFFKDENLDKLNTLLNKNT